MSEPHEQHTFDLGVDDIDFGPDPSPTTTGAADVDMYPEPPASPEELAAIASQVLDEQHAIAALPIIQALPTDFPSLAALLTFVPDVALKRRLDAIAAEAETLAVTGHEGLAAADALREQLREGIATALAAFDGSNEFPGPTKLSHALWKRMTGLRGDFTDRGTTAMESLNRRIVAETKRLEALAAEQRRRDQAQADVAVKQTVAKAAEEAKRANAPKPIVDALEQQVATATAPPVAGSVLGPRMASTSVVPKWRGRLQETPADAEPHPKTDELTVPQQVQARRVLKAILDGEAPLTFVDFNWGKIDKRAESDKTTFAIPGLEAYDEGSARSKGRR